ncbi:UDP-2,3-diacylglucosamine diphosphatase [Geomonas subterranea]|uniref:UDP-2,3-diacylglucosamine diphosphatase n=1 Tax=Geomonas subterranea TaxID=2847989 RepID=A0ABX8LCN4_9BACT|nr:MULTISPECIES: UDP-2,3-diacylglucosamine diphosphatase [Geomonas]QXE89432.1 UDP-2,3-diacylglucosamine diphosphatase [Geomonas subterranea]QXM08452.1 UDP-2,3-diacylglucosamine diphosphatase [Geomonas subterranea]
MRKIFIADAHLRSPRDRNYRTLVRFLDTLPADTDTLFLLGDIFEFWIGNPRPVYDHYREIVECLKRVRGRGVRIVYFEGNHDFHLGDFFKEQLQAEVHAGGAECEVDGKKVCLCHGDQLNRADYGYRALRFALHNPLVRALVPVFPRRLADRIAVNLSRRSSGQHASRKSRWDYPAILENFARERFAAGCDLVVTGHFHLPMEIREGGRAFISLGDWITHYSYAQWTEAGLTLERFD